MDALGPWHLLIIAAFFVMLFGAKRLPEAARALGRSARIMKTELTGMRDETPKVETGPLVTAPVDKPVVATAAVETAADRDDGPR